MKNKAIEYADGQLVNGDCIEVVTNIEDQSVDLVFTSPPYFMGKHYDRSMSIDDFTNKITEIQDKIYPKLKKGGSLCWQVGTHVQNSIATPLDCLVYHVCKNFPDLKLRNRVVWTFEHGYHATKRLSGRHETILWYTNGDEHRFELDAIRVPQKYPGKKHYKGPNKGELSGNPLGKNPGDVWCIPNVKANHIEKTDHPCQFPVALAARFIRALTPENGLILDPFSGSGTTAIASLQTGRKFYCVEIDENYFTISKERITDWYEGNRRVRDDAPSAIPNPRSAVARRPEHFQLEMHQ